MHDAIRHIQGLRLSLAQDKAPLGLFLAAGCPVSVRLTEDPLIPDIQGMTAKLGATLTAGAQAAAFEKLSTCLLEDGVDDPNMEDWLTHLRALRLVAGGAAVRGLTKEDLDGLEEEITSGIVRLADVELPADSTPFHSVAAWAGAIERELPIEVFTTNYDLLLEQAFESMRRPYFDGFVGVREPFFDNASVSIHGGSPLPPRFTRVWKLHGSINWYLASSGQVTRSQERLGLRRLIHPSHLKYDESRQMPYLAMLERLRAFLGQRGALLVTCGYSFGDQHINAVLDEGLQSNPTSSLVGLMFGELARYDQAKKLALLRPNLGLYAFDQAVIGTRLGPWERTAASGPDVLGVRDNPAGDTEVILGDFAEFGQVLSGLLPDTTLGL